MRTPWVKINKGLRSNLKVLKIARALSVSACAVVGMLVDFWGEVEDYSQDGKLPGIGLEDIDSYIDQQGFGAALVAVGWLSVVESGLEIPDFDKHCGRESKKRTKTAERVSRHRAKNPTAVPTPQEPPVPIPPEFQVVPFLEAWKAWEAHRVQKKAKLTRTTAKLQIAKLVKMGLARAIACLKFSAEQGYTGLFEEKKGKDRGGKQGSGLRYDSASDPNAGQPVDGLDFEQAPDDKADHCGDAGAGETGESEANRPPF